MSSRKLAVYKPTLLAVSTLWLASLALAAPVTQAAEAKQTTTASRQHPAIANRLIAENRLIAQTSSANSQELSRLLKEGRKLVDTGNFPGALAAYQQAASLDGKNAKIFSGI